MTKKLLTSIFLILSCIYVLCAQIIVPIGTETTANTTTGAPSPYGTYYKNFRQQYLYSAAELSQAGAVPGSISALAFNVLSLNNCSPMPNFRIRLKTTAQTVLSTTFEAGVYAQVWHHENFLPSVGWNIHTLSSPFVWDGSSNLIVDILTDLVPGNYTQNASVFYTATTGNNTALRYQSDSQAADIATTGMTSINRANIRFYMNVGPVGSLRGVVTEGGIPLGNVNLSIENTAFSTISATNGTYSFSYLPVGYYTLTAAKHGYTPVSNNVMIVDGQETVQNISMLGVPQILVEPNQWNYGDVGLGGNVSKLFSIRNSGGGLLEINSISVSGNPAFTLDNLPNLPLLLGSEQFISFTATFSPTFPGVANASISIIDNQGTRIEDRQTHTIPLEGNGVSEITIGDGSQNAKVPLDFWYKASLFETIYPAEELSNFTGMITGLKFYNSFVSDLPDMPTKIWLGTTTLANLAGGWIPSNALSLVFDGNVHYPDGENTISILFSEPYMYLQGGNLVMMIQRPLDTVYYNNGDNFKAQTVGTNRSRKLQSDTINYDPTTPSAGSLSGQFPKTTFIVIPGGVGHITGTVMGENSALLAGVQVSLNGLDVTLSNNDGYFQIPNLIPGEYTLGFSIYGYLDQIVVLNLEEDETEVLSINMQAMPKVSVSGAILASDTQAGIAGVSISLSGYNNYHVTSATDGSFSIPDVYADHSYSYHITHPQYSGLSGTIEVLQTPFSFGNIQLNELAFAPYALLAQPDQSASAVTLSWLSPNPDAIGIVESFEDALFPPQNWEQIILNNGSLMPNGAYPTWHRNQVVASGTTPINPTDGSFQAGLWWDYRHQDEWLISAPVLCPSDAVLSFDSYVFYGSTNGDNYFVKISLDNGETWSVLWNASEQTGGWNHYSAPVVVDLSDYSGSSIRIAFHAEDPATNDGLYYQWFIDNVKVVSTLIASQRGLLGYDLWRMNAEHQHNPELWTQVNVNPISANVFNDSGWASLPQGEYRWAVKARYSNDVLSSASLSNILEKIGGIPAAPQNLQITIIGDDLLLSWDPVIEDTAGNPINITDYSLHFLNGPDDPAVDENIFEITPETSFYIPEVTPYLDSFFFSVKARANARGATTSKNILPRPLRQLFVK